MHHTYMSCPILTKYAFEKINEAFNASSKNLLRIYETIFPSVKIANHFLLMLALLSTNPSIHTYNFGVRFPVD